MPCQDGKDSSRKIGLNQNKDFIGSAMVGQVYEKDVDGLQNISSTPRPGSFQVKDPLQTRLLPGTLGTVGEPLDGIARIHEYILDTL